MSQVLTLKKLIASNCQTEYEFLLACCKAGLSFAPGEQDEYTDMFPEGDDSPPPAGRGTE